MTLEPGVLSREEFQALRISKEIDTLSKRLSREEFLALWGLWTLKNEKRQVASLEQIAEAASYLTVATVSKDAIRDGLFLLLQGGVVGASRPWYVRALRHPDVFSLCEDQEWAERVMAPRVAALNAPPESRSRRSLLAG